MSLYFRRFRPVDQCDWFTSFVAATRYNAIESVRFDPQMLTDNKLTGSRHHLQAKSITLSVFGGAVLLMAQGVFYNGVGLMEPRLIDYS